MIDKVLDIAGMLLEMTGKQNGRDIAAGILKSGKAEQKFREIVREQGGNPEVRPEDIKIGEYGTDYNAVHSGVVLWMDNNALVEIARAAGAPKDKGAGIVIHKKVGDTARKGERLFTIISEKARKLERTKRVLEEIKPIEVGSRMEVLIHKVKETPMDGHKKAFMLER
jgi:AMP phosphorylase